MEKARSRETLFLRSPERGKGISSFVSLFYREVEQEDRLGPENTSDVEQIRDRSEVIASLFMTILMAVAVFMAVAILEAVFVAIFQFHFGKEPEAGRFDKVG